MTVLLSKRWLLAEPANPQYLRRFRGLHPLLAQVLINRGLDSYQAATEFLYAKNVTYNPFDMPDMAKAVGRIRQAITRGEKIVIYGDFDADGVTSTALLMQTLRAFRANAEPYIPHRVDEGYGLNSPALLELAERGVSLVITVDCGIRSVEEVEDARAAGIDLIITDHHSLGPTLPDAFAVINCKRPGYPEPMLAGVGVAFKLAQALIMADRNNRKYGKRKGHDPIDVADLMDLVALGTVADMMPLHHMENRVLVRRGLEKINTGQRPGIRALMDVAGVEPGKVSSTTIGFSLAPRINAAGRLDDAMIAYRLLASNSMEEAQEWAQTLQDLNTQRQNFTREAQSTIREQLEDSTDLPLIFAAHEGFLPGIVGLVAGRLTEEFFRPTVVMELGEDESRASCRSIPQFDITNALDQCADLLVRHGGHALAAGFTVANDNINALRERLSELAAEALAGQTLTPTLDIDAEVDVHQISEELISAVSLLEPFGNGNPLPVLMTRNVHVSECKTVGKDNRHLKLKLSRAGQPPLDAIGFGLGEWVAHMPQRIDIAYQLEINEWNGRRNIQANLQDIRPAESR